MRSIFSIIFAIAAITFIIFYTHYSDTFYYVGSLHIAIFSAAMFFLYKKNMKNTLKKIGIPGELKKNLFYTVEGIIGLFVMVMILNVIFYAAGIQDGSKVYRIVNQLPGYLLIFAVVVAPITEELFFRALMVEKFGLVVSSFVFAISHAAYGSIAQLAGAFFLGLVLAVIYRRSGSIVPCILTHAFFNLVSVLVMIAVGG